MSSLKFALKKQANESHVAHVCCLNAMRAMHHPVQREKSCKFDLQYLSEQQTVCIAAVPAHESALERHGLRRCSHPCFLHVRYPVLQGHE